MDFQTAKIRWYDALSGEGMVRLGNGESVYFHFSSLRDQLKPKELPKNRCHAFPSDYDWSFNIEDGMTVQVQVYRDYNYKQVNKMKVEA